MTYTYMHYFWEVYHYRCTIARLCREGKEQNITLSADAQQFRQKIQNLGALDLTDEKIINKIPEVFWKTAVCYNIHLYPKDVDYINDKIRPNPIFNLIPSFNHENLVSTSNIAIFYETILADPTIPKGIESVIMIYLGEACANPKPIPETREEFEVNDALAARRPLIELWFEMVNLTH